MIVMYIGCLKSWINKILSEKHDYWHGFLYILVNPNNDGRYEHTEKEI